MRCSLDQYLTLYIVNMTFNLKNNNPMGACMYLYLFTSMAWKFICTVCKYWDGKHWRKALKFCSLYSQVYEWDTFNKKQRLYAMSNLWVDIDKISYHEHPNQAPRLSNFFHAQLDWAWNFNCS